MPPTYSISYYTTQPPIKQQAFSSYSKETTHLLPEKTFLTFERPNLK